MSYQYDGDADAVNISDLLLKTTFLVIMHDRIRNVSGRYRAVFFLLNILNALMITNK